MFCRSEFWWSNLICYAYKNAIDMNKSHKIRIKTRTLLTMLYISIFYVGVAFVAYKFVTKDDIRDGSAPASLQDILKEEASTGSTNTPGSGTGSSVGSDGGASDDGVSTSSNSSGSSSRAVAIPTQQQAETQSSCTEQQGVPRGACEALQKAQNNFTAANSVFVYEAQSAMASLVDGSVMIYKGTDYKSGGDTKGTIKLDVRIPGVGQRRPEATLELRGNQWVISKLQVS